MTDFVIDALRGRGYVPESGAFATGRPDRSTIALVSATGEPVVAKHYPVGGGRETFVAMCDLWKSSLGARRNPAGLPEPIDYLEDVHVLVMERVPGRPMVELAEPHEGLLRRAVTMLAELHNTGVVPLKRRTAKGVLRSMGRKAADVAEMAPQLARDFAGLVDALVAAQPADAPLVPSHGDFSPRNVIVGDDRLVFIDWDRFRLADPARDVAYQGAWTWAWALRQGRTPTWSALDRGMSLYDELRPSAQVHERATFYVAAALGRIAHSIVLLWHDDIGVVPQLLDEATGRLR